MAYKGFNPQTSQEEMFKSKKEYENFIAQLFEQAQSKKQEKSPEEIAQIAIQKDVERWGGNVEDFQVIGAFFKNGKNTVIFVSYNKQSGSFQIAQFYFTWKSTRAVKKWTSEDLTQFYNIIKQFDK